MVIRGAVENLRRFSVLARSAGFELPDLGSNTPSGTLFLLGFVEFDLKTGRIESLRIVTQRPFITTRSLSLYSAQFCRKHPRQKRNGSDGTSRELCSARYAEFNDMNKKFAYRPTRKELALLRLP